MVNIPLSPPRLSPGMSRLAVSQPTSPAVILRDVALTPSPEGPIGERVRKGLLQGHDGSNNNIFPPDACPAAGPAAEPNQSDGSLLDRSVKELNSPEATAGSNFITLVGFIRAVRKFLFGDGDGDGAGAGDGSSPTSSSSSSSSSPEREPALA